MSSALISDFVQGAFSPARRSSPSTSTRRMSPAAASDCPQDPPIARGLRRTYRPDAAGESSGAPHPVRAPEPDHDARPYCRCRGFLSGCAIISVSANPLDQSTLDTLSLTRAPTPTGPCCGSRANVIQTACAATCPTRSRLLAPRPTCRGSTQSIAHVAGPIVTRGSLRRSPGPAGSHLFGVQVVPSHAGDAGYGRRPHAHPKEPTWRSKTLSSESPRIAEGACGGATGEDAVGGSYAHCAQRLYSLDHVGQ